MDVDLPLEGLYRLDTSQTQNHGQYAERHYNTAASTMFTGRHLHLLNEWGD